MMRFRRRGSLPQLRNYPAGRKPGLLLFRRRGRPAGAIGRRVQSVSPGSRSIGWLMAVAIVLAVIAAAPLWLPAVSWVIPDRYIMAYAPEPIQQMVFQVNPAEQVPTVAAVDSAEAENLLASLAPTATPTPGGSNFGGPGSFVQPTPMAVAPTPTLTPVFSVQVDSRAVDRENRADLGDISHLLTGFEWEQQGYNNCGPASVRTLMSYWGVEFTEAEAAAYLKPDPEDPNVRPDEIATFVEQYGYQALTRVDGDFDLVKQFLLAGYPVLIETGYDPEPDTIGWTSHYLTLAGYSDEGLIAMDTYRRPNWFYPYNEVDYYWRQFNRRYIIIFRPDQAVAVASIVGDEMNDTVMYENALRTAQAESSLNREDPFAWFNLGSSLVALGRYEDAALAFDQARNLGLPSRFLWYQFTPYEAYLQVGRYEDVIALADDVLGKKASEEAYYYKGLALLELGETDRARIQLSMAVRQNRNYAEARAALETLDGG